MVVWRLVSLPTSMVRPVADRIPDVTDSVNVPSGLPMAMTSWPTLSAELSPIGMVGRAVGRGDLDDREVVGRSLGDDRAGQLRAVLEGDGDLVAALDDVVVRQDQTGGIEDEARPDAGRWHRERPVSGLSGRLHGQRHDGRAGRLGDRHDRVRGRDVERGAWRDARVATGRCPCRCRSAAPNPVSSPTVPTDPTTADSMETARTPASHRPRNGREEVAVPLGVAMGSPTTIAAGAVRPGRTADRCEWRRRSGWDRPAVDAVHDRQYSPRSLRRS